MTIEIMDKRSTDSEGKDYSWSPRETRRLRLLEEEEMMREASRSNEILLRGLEELIRRAGKGVAK